jgi:non-canonical (house-cleaning) NTP pyrophosphatase
MQKIYGIPEIGKKQGAIGLLSKGLIDRKTLTEQSVISALIPRMEHLQPAAERSYRDLRR